MIWGNDKEFTKEFQIKCREEQQKRYNEYLERVANEKQPEPDPIIGSALHKYTEEAIARGEILNPFIEQHLEGKIQVARWTLALGIVITALFKGQWVLWILFIILYNVYVSQARQDALEKDRRKRQK